ncbi:MAG TPA: DUF2061 domain-containing protein [Burkholderiaceae bacterium]|nr:DUF2061 domain-containing protein [Burkholderiaceae bacterium]
MAKTAAFGVMHLGIAFSVSYALTGSVAISGLITLVEPLCNTIAHYFFDKYWGDPRVVGFLRRLLPGSSRRAAEPASVSV